MFGGKFGLIRFGLRGEAQVDIEVGALFIERVRSLVSAGENVIIEKEFREHCDTDAILTRGVPVSHNFKEAVSSRLEMVRDYTLSTEFSEGVRAIVWLSGNIEATHNFLESISADVFLAKDTPVVHDYLESVLGSALLGKDIPLAHEFREAVFALTMATLLEERSFVASVTLGPGEELRVDSELFTALVGSANVIHQYKGDWLVLDRDTINLQVNGNLTGRLVYQERYL